MQPNGPICASWNLARPQFGIDGSKFASVRWGSLPNLYQCRHRQSHTKGRWYRRAALAPTFKVVHDGLSISPDDSAIPLT